MNLREQILKKTEEPRKLEAITFAGVECFLSEMTGFDRDAFEAEQLEGNRNGTALVNFRARTLVKVLVDKDGVRIFSDEDAATVGQLPARELRKAFDKASKLNALTDEDVKELEKKS